MIRFFTLALTLALATFASMASANNDANSEQAAEQLADMLRDYESYQADFIQIVVNENGARVQETQGKLKAKRPGYFYWETGGPMTQFVVSDGEKVEVYDPDLEQVTVHTLDDQVQTTPALLLSGEVDNLNEIYQVSERRLGDQTREFKLTPRATDSLFVSLRLSFHDGVLQEMRMEDSLAQLTILSFDGVVLNERIGESLFQLDYPEGVDIIRDGV